jgi:NAD(P)H-hydrate epimerase
MSDGIVRLTRRQVREVDRIAIEQYYIPGIVLMENAARGAAEVAVEMIDRRDARVLIFCGGGNNGGDGYAVARHLANRGYDVAVATTVDPAKLNGDALTNWRIARAMGVPMEPASTQRPAIGPALVIDAIFGTGLSEPPREPFGELAEAINGWGLPVLAIDVPSGFDCDTGKPLGAACIRATRTVTFVKEKRGFGHRTSRQYTGEVTVVDIGCPPEIVQKVMKIPNR